jgi:hypothetical protein
MKKKTYVVGVAVMLAGLLALSGVAQSAMWVGAELGGNFQPSNDVAISAPGLSRTTGSEIRPSVIGGAIIGYDFVNAGFGAYAWPDWMKYFSFATDFTYNRLSVTDGGPGVGRYISGSSRINGWEAAWTFLFMGHYGFLPDSEVPTGRIVPYLGIGPAIVWTGVQGTLPFLTLPNQRVRSANIGDTTMNVALVVEPGIRWMCMKNVSIDTSMRWRYSQPSWSDEIVTVKVNPLSQFAFLVRANYHF